MWCRSVETGFYALCNGGTGGSLQFWKASEREVFVVVETGFYAFCSGGTGRSLQFGRVFEGEVLSIV